MTVATTDIHDVWMRGRRCDRRVYYGSITYTTSGPFGGDLVIAFGVLCTDGKRRIAYPSGRGIADTFFSIPAFVYARTGEPGDRRTVRVYGYVTHETMKGFTTETEGDPTTVKFFAYTYRKHWDAIPDTRRLD